MREATIERKTKETDITLTLALDEAKDSGIATGVGFLDHMLEAFARFAGFGLTVRCQGDLYVDAHHTVEDVGICLGQAIKQALGDKAGIRRVGQASVPMDEALATVVLDMSGRPYLVFDAKFTKLALGEMPTQLIEEFFRAVSSSAAMTLHLAVPYGRNDHHKAEALFKAFGLAMQDACRLDARIVGVLSTKGAL